MCKCNKPEPVETFQNDGNRVDLYVDDDATHPRENDNLSHMVCAHRRYNLGDEQRSEGETEEELRERVPGILAVLPLYLYDHSGVTISTSPFGCRFDSGQVGWAYVTEESARVMGCVGDEWPVSRLEESIRGEVEEYDRYLRGEVYGYVVTDAYGEETDSCWGLIGREYAIEEARGALLSVPQAPTLQFGASCNG